MASIATITATATKVSVEAGTSVEHTFTVSNTTGDTLKYSLKAVPEGKAEADWLVCEGPSERELSAGESEQVTVRIGVPEGTNPEEYTFHLLAYSAERPGEDFTEGPTVGFTVKAPKAEPKKEPFPWKWAAIAATVLVVLVGGGFGVWKLMDGGGVPDVEGMDIAKAKAKLGKAGFKVEVKKVVPNDSEKAKALPGQVTNQTPKGGAEAPEDKKISLDAYVDKERVPEVTGLSVRDAKIVLRRKLKPFTNIETVTVPTDVQGNENKVKEQKPKNKKIWPNGKITLTVSTLPDSVKVPNVLGMPKAQAITKLRMNDLKGKVVGEKETEEFQEGAIFRQNPVGGSSTSFEGTVELTVSVPVPMVDVPNVVGLPEEKAKEKLKGQGIGVRLISAWLPDTRPGHVGKQKPGEGEAKKGRDVVLYIASEKEDTKVPDLQGLTRKDAELRLYKSGLEPGDVNFVNNDDRKDVVVNQGVEAGTQKKKGDSVGFTVEMGPFHSIPPELVRELRTKYKSLDFVQERDLVVPGEDVVVPPAQ